MVKGFVKCDRCCGFCRWNPTTNISFPFTTVYGGRFCSSSCATRYIYMSVASVKIQKFYRKYQIKSNI